MDHRTSDHHLNAEYTPLADEAISIFDALQQQGSFNSSLTDYSIACIDGIDDWMAPINQGDAILPAERRGEDVVYNGNDAHRHVTGQPASKRTVYAVAEHGICDAAPRPVVPLTFWNNNNAFDPAGEIVLDTACSTTVASDVVGLAHYDALFECSHKSDNTNRDAAASNTCFLDPSTSFFNPSQVLRNPHSCIPCLDLQQQECIISNAILSHDQSIASRQGFYPHVVCLFLLTSLDFLTVGKRLQRVTSTSIDQAVNALLTIALMWTEIWDLKYLKEMMQHFWILILKSLSPWREPALAAKIKAAAMDHVKVANSLATDLSNQVYHGAERPSLSTAASPFDEASTTDRLDDFLTCQCSNSPIDQMKALVFAFKHRLSGDGLCYGYSVCHQRCTDCRMVFLWSGSESTRLMGAERILSAESYRRVTVLLQDRRRRNTRRAVATYPRPLKWFQYEWHYAGEDLEGGLDITSDSIADDATPDESHAPKFIEFESRLQYEYHLNADGDLTCGPHEDTYAMNWRYDDEGDLRDEYVELPREEDVEEDSIDAEEWARDLYFRFRLAERMCTDRQGACLDYAQSDCSGDEVCVDCFGDS